MVTYRKPLPTTRTQSVGVCKTKSDTSEEMYDKSFRRGPEQKLERLYGGGSDEHMVLVLACMH